VLRLVKVPELDFAIEGGGNEVVVECVNAQASNFAGVLFWRKEASVQSTLKVELLDLAIQVTEYSKVAALRHCDGCHSGVLENLRLTHIDLRDAVIGIGPHVRLSCS